MHNGEKGNNNNNNKEASPLIVEEGHSVQSQKSSSYHSYPRVDSRAIIDETETKYECHNG